MDQEQSMQQEQNALILLLEKIKGTTQTFLALGVVIASFIFFFFIVYRPMRPGTTSEILFFILGIMSGQVTQIISYYFGSSKGSDEKSSTIHNLTRK